MTQRREPWPGDDNPFVFTVDELGREFAQCMKCLEYVPSRDLMAWRYMGSSRLFPRLRLLAQLPGLMWRLTRFAFQHQECMRRHTEG